jgi:sulfatase modifying factor 1
MTVRVENRIRSLAALVVATTLLAAPALAQDVIGSVTLDTTAGRIFIDLEEDHPGVRDHARAFANMVKDRVFFHRSDKTIACDVDDANCFPCTCQLGATVNCLDELEGTCAGDLNMRTCTQETTFFVNDQLEPSATLHAGLFDLDAGNHLEEIGDTLDPTLQNSPGIFENNRMTVAFVRDDITGLLTSEWIINVEDNSEILRINGKTFDDEDGEGAEAYLVFGLVIAGQDVVSTLAGLPAIDARCEQSLLDDGTLEAIRRDLGQLPLVDFDVEPLPELVTFCAANDDTCLEPLCEEISDDGLTCSSPLCYSLRPLTQAEQDIVDQGGVVDRFCEFPEQPNFPLITESTPAGLGLVANGLAPPEPLNVVDYPNNPSLTVDVRNEGCPDDPLEPGGVCTNPGAPTFLEVTTGGSVGLLRVSDASRATILDSSLDSLGTGDAGAVDSLELFDTARAFVNQGTATSLITAATSDVAVSGGAIETWLATESSTGLMSGGTSDEIRAEDSSFLRIAGSSFAVDASAVPFGPIAATSGNLTGTLAESDALSALFAQGDTVGTATGLIHLLDENDLTQRSETVLVAAPGNAADDVTGLGNVSSAFNIGQTEVTNGQYLEFLSAIAFSDPHGLYNTQMSDDPRGGITRTGADGNYRYESIRGKADQPVVFVSYLDAIRYLNWRHNGRPAGVGDAATEDGAYDLTQCTAFCTRKPGARVSLPTTNEWYKAAYYDPASGSYFAYPTASNAQPANQAPAFDIGNHANGNNALGDDQSPLADAGAYRFSSSPSRTLDQAGNVREWLEDSLDLRGGSWSTADAAERQATTTVASNAEELSDLGFRVPEPSTRLLSIAALLTLFASRRRISHRR